MKTWRWKDPIYGIDVVLMHGDGVERFVRRLNKRAGWTVSDKDIEKIANSWASAPYHRDDKTRTATLYLWFCKKVDHKTVFGLSTIGHEAVHGAIHVFDDLQMPITRESEEPFAYYQTYLFTEVLRRLRGQRGSSR